MITCDLHRPSARPWSDDYQVLCVPIQWGDAGVPPVFCVPGAGASVTSFVPLAEALGRGTPVYGLQPRGLDGRGEPFLHVQEAAQAYLPLLKRAVRDRPFKLIGHSFGGWIAFEMARQLERERECELQAPLILVDSPCPSDSGVLGTEYRSANVLGKLVELLEQACGRSLRISQQDLACLAEADRVPLLARAMASVGLISSRTDTGVIGAMVRVFEANVNTRYRPATPLRASAILVQASDASSVIQSELCVDSLVGWRGFVPRLTASVVPGNHMTMLAKPHVAALANIVQSRAHLEPGRV